MRTFFATLLFILHGCPENKPIKTYDALTINFPIKLEEGDIIYFGKLANKITTDQWIDGIYLKKQKQNGWFQFKGNVIKNDQR